MSKQLLPSRAAVDLAAALRVYAEDVNGVRSELRDTDDNGHVSYTLAGRLNEAAELIRVLARLVEGKSIHDAFGAPGDFGYDNPIGAALARYYGGR